MIRLLSPCCATPLYTCDCCDVTDASVSPGHDSSEGAVPAMCWRCRGEEYPGECLQCGEPPRGHCPSCHEDGYAHAPTCELPSTDDNPYPAHTLGAWSHP